MRENKYDLLRIVSCAMVVMLHSGAFFVASQVRINHIAGVICQGITRTAVPCFVMLSGAFLLNDEKWKSFSYAVEKTKNNILKPTIFYTIVFVLFSCMMYRLGFTEANYIEVISLTIQGYPYPHMWYMYMCIGLYLATPLIWKIKEDYGGGYTAGAFLVFGYIIQRTCQLYWPIKFIPFIGYFMVGAYLHTSDLESCKVKIVSVVTWIFFICLSCIEQIFWPDKNIWGLPFTDPLNPLIIIASVSCFAFFSSLSLKRDYYNISKHTDTIYFVHIVIQQIMWTLGERLFPNVNAIIKILVIFVFSFALSYIYSVIVKIGIKLLPIRKAI